VEIDGLDSHEHGLASAYSGFAVSDVTNMVMDVNENTDLGEGEYEKATAAQISAAVKVTAAPGTTGVAAGGGASAGAAAAPSESDTGMHKVSIICRLSKFDELKHALNELGVTGMTMTQVMGCGIQKGSTERYRGAVVDSTLLPKVKVEVIVSQIPVSDVIEAAKKALYTGHIGDGKIFVYNVMKVVKVRTGEEDYAALQDVE
jgi:Amt family ammonium transporter